MFVRGGGVKPGSNLNYAGNYGSYWSSLGRDSNNAFYLYFDLDGANATNSNFRRYFGYSVRCVALGG